MTQQAATDINAVVPPTLNHMIGMGSAVERIQVAVDAMFNQGGDAAFPSTLLLGPKGTGKTLLAQTVAKETGLADKFCEVLGQAINSPSTLNRMLMDAEGGILFIDEMHSLPPAAQIDLLKAVEQKRIYINRSEGAPTEMTLGNFTVIGATTEEYGILSPLLDRFRLIIRMDFYSEADLARILEQRARALGWHVEDGLFAEIAKRGKQTPRVALRLLDSCWRTAKASNAAKVTAEHFRQATRLEEIDAIGCDKAEQAYLRFLAEAEGKARLNVLATRLGLPTRTVEGLEQFLIRNGLVDKNDYGVRVLTPKGMLHLRGETKASAESKGA